MPSVDWDDYAKGKLRADEANYLDTVWEIYLAKLANPAYANVHGTTVTKSAFKDAEAFMSVVYERYTEDDPFPHPES